MRLNCIQTDDQLLVEAYGFPDQLVYTGEILMWLTCAVRSSPDSNQLGYAEPVMSVLDREELVFHVSVRTPSTPLAIQSRNSCWARLFRNPAIAFGFPVLQQPHLGMARGLCMEMSLPMMATLAEASHVSMLGDRIVMKGYSCFLVPTVSTDTAIVWHAICNEDGSYMSHFDPRILHVSPKPQRTILLSELDFFRHFVGWCTIVKSGLGEFNIRPWP